MMSNPLFAFRIPPDLEGKIETRALEVGVSKSEVVVDALRLYFGDPRENSLKQQTLDLQQRVAKLEAVVGVG